MSDPESMSPELLCSETVVIDGERCACQKSYGHRGSHVTSPDRPGGAPSVSWTAPTNQRGRAGPVAAPREDDMGTDALGRMVRAHAILAEWDDGLIGAKKAEAKLLEILRVEDDAGRLDLDAIRKRHMDDASNMPSVFRSPEASAAHRDRANLIAEVERPRGSPRREGAIEGPTVEDLHRAFRSAWNRARPIGHTEPEIREAKLREYFHLPHSTKDLVSDPDLMDDQSFYLDGPWRGGNVGYAYASKKEGPATLTRWGWYQYDTFVCGGRPNPKAIAVFAFARTPEGDYKLTGADPIRFPLTADLPRT